jgi:hypothetical protein
LNREAREGERWAVLGHVAGSEGSFSGVRRRLGRSGLGRYQHRPISTFGTIGMIDKNVDSQGIKCINPLNGFKWIGEKRFNCENKMLEQEYESMVMSTNDDKN